jgi:hypothetical protein
MLSKEGLLSRRLLRNVLCQGLYQITILLIILYAGDAIWHFSVSTELPSIVMD